MFFDEFQEIASPQQPYGDPDRLTKRMRAIFQRSDGRQLPVRRQPRAPDARPVHAVAPRAAPVRRLPRPAPDRPQRLDGRPRRALRGRRLHRRAERAVADRRLRRAAPPHDHADRAEEPPDHRRTRRHGRWTGRSSSRGCSRRSPPTASATSRRWSASAGCTSSGWSSPSGWRGASRSTRACHAERVRRALEGLRDAAMIESRGRGDWRFTSPLLRRYLADLSRFD